MPRGVQRNVAVHLILGLLLSLGRGNHLAALAQSGGAVPGLVSLIGQNAGGVADQPPPAAPPAPADQTGPSCEQIWRALCKKVAGYDMVLEPDQDAYCKGLDYTFWQVRWAARSVTDSQKKEISRLFRLYVFLSGTSGVDFHNIVVGASGMRRDLNLSDNDYQRGFTLLKSAEKSTTLNWLISVLAGFQGDLYRAVDYGDQLRQKLSEWKDSRGLPVADVVFLYLLENYPGAFFVDQNAVSNTANRPPAGPPFPLVETSNVFTYLIIQKLSPSLDFNNKVAFEISKSYTWEQLGMDVGNKDWIDWSYSRLAQLGYEHPVIVRLIPVFGACWGAADCLLSACEAKDGGERAVAIAGFAACLLEAITEAQLATQLARNIAAASSTRQLLSGIRGILKPGPVTLEQAQEVHLLLESEIKGASAEGRASLEATGAGADAGKAQGLEGAALGSTQEAQQAANAGLKAEQARVRALAEEIGPAAKPAMIRPRELPFKLPPEYAVIEPGKPLDPSKLEVGQKYLYVVREDGNIVIAREEQAGFSRLVKHRDLVPAADGQSALPARFGGELVREADGTIKINSDSSYVFLRADKINLMDPKYLDKTIQLFKELGVDVSHFQPKYD